MPDDELRCRVRELRAAGRSPKRIARALGVRPAAVSPLVRLIAQEPALVGCWVSPGWSRGLSVDGHDEWPDTDQPNDGTEGLAGVVVARRHRSHERDLPDFLHRLFIVSEEFLAAPLDLAHHLVWGAVDYAPAGWASSPP
ncbi:MAG: hypothetical protein ACRD0K_05825 [Egibacteraceae bacterium]